MQLTETTIPVIELEQLRAKAESYDKAMSLPLADGTRLNLMECFTVEDTYPFFSDGVENYNAQLMWDDVSKCLFYDIYRVSYRVLGAACGSSIDQLDLRKIVRRKVRVMDEVKA